MKRLFAVLLLLALYCPGARSQGSNPAAPPDAPSSFIRSNVKWLAPVAVDLSLTAWDAKASSPPHVNCHEDDPLLGRNPSALRYWGQMMATTVAIDFLAWKLRKHHPQWSQALIFTDSGSHAWGVESTYVNCSAGHNWFGFGPVSHTHMFDRQLRCFLIPCSEQSESLILKGKSR